MNSTIYRYLEECRMYYRQAKEQVQLHWKKGLAIAFVVFILIKKDVDIDVSLDGPAVQTAAWPDLSGIWEAAGSLVSFKDEEPSYSPEDYVAPVNTSMFSSTEEDTPAPDRTNRRPEPEEEGSEANTFSNLSFSENEGTARSKAEKKRKQQKYIREFSQSARREMLKYGIPASVTLAQGLLESNAGESSLATRNRNHFGIKCFSRSCAKGHCSNFSDDHHKDFFRIYPNSADSYRAHSQLLMSGRYRHLFKLDRTDYRSWARGLRRAGYATDKQYAEKLIHLIEELNLHKYDL